MLDACLPSCLPASAQALSGRARTTYRKRFHTIALLPTELLVHIRPRNIHGPQIYKPSAGISKHSEVFRVHLELLDVHKTILKMGVHWAAHKVYRKLRKQLAG